VPAPNVPGATGLPGVMVPGVVVPALLPKVLVQGVPSAELVLVCAAARPGRPPMAAAASAAANCLVIVFMFKAP
jgi:hypothetical protein